MKKKQTRSANTIFSCWSNFFFVNECYPRTMKIIAIKIWWRNEFIFTVVSIVQYGYANYSSIWIPSLHSKRNSAYLAYVMSANCPYKITKFLHTLETRQRGTRIRWNNCNYAYRRLFIISVYTVCSTIHSTANEMGSFSFRIFILHRIPNKSPIKVTIIRDLGVIFIFAIFAANSDNRCDAWLPRYAN